MEGLGSWFLGEYENTVDGQRRISIPRAWRQEAPQKTRFFLLPGREKSLQLVPAETFQEMLVEMRKVSFADPQAAIALATIGSMAQECVCDRQGRISLTPKLLAHAGIEDRAVLLGSVTSIQIWRPETWEARRMDSESCLDVIQAVQERPDDFTQILRNAGKS
jgi:MraZ protein